MKMKLYMGVTTLCILLMICGVNFLKHECPSSTSDNISSSGSDGSSMNHKKTSVSQPSIAESLQTAEMEYLSSLSPEARDRYEKLRKTASFQKGLSDIEKLLETSSSTPDSSSLSPEIVPADIGELIYTHYQERLTSALEDLSPEARSLYDALFPQQSKAEVLAELETIAAMSDTQRLDFFKQSLERSEELSEFSESLRSEISRWKTEDAARKVWLDLLAKSAYATEVLGDFEEPEVSVNPTSEAAAEPVNVFPVNTENKTDMLLKSRMFSAAAELRASHPHASAALLLPKEALDVLYPSASEQQSLAVQRVDIQQAVVSAFRPFLSDTSDKQKQFTLMREVLSTYWNTDFAQKVITELDKH